VPADRQPPVPFGVVGGVRILLARIRSARVPAGVLAAVLVGLLTVGCSDDHPPWNCPWYPTPDGITAADLAGDYTISDTPGGELRLDGDGTYTTTGFTYADWLTGTSLEFPAGRGRWEAEIEKEPGWGVPLVDVPVLGGRQPQLRSIDLLPEKGNRTELHVGGTRDQPALAESSSLAGDDCTTWSSLFRQS
jgi:hypothetical protein